VEGRNLDVEQKVDRNSASRISWPGSPATVPRGQWSPGRLDRGLLANPVKRTCFPQSQGTLIQPTFFCINQPRNCADYMD